MTWRQLIVELMNRSWVDLDTEAQVAIYHRDRNRCGIKFEVSPIKFITDSTTQRTKLVIEADEIKEYKPL